MKRIKLILIFILGSILVLSTNITGLAAGQDNSTLVLEKIIGEKAKTINRIVIKDVSKGKSIILSDPKDIRNFIYLLNTTVVQKSKYQLKQKYNYTIIFKYEQDDDQKQLLSIYFGNTIKIFNVKYNIVYSAFSEYYIENMIKRYYIVPKIPENLGETSICIPCNRRE